ncbi:hypothetical protein ES702_06157 [subsurface metagenome]
MKNKNNAKIEDVNVEIIKQRYRRACERTIKELRLFGYVGSYIQTPETKRIFDISSESPFLDQTKDVGSFIKVCVDSVTQDEIKAIEDYPTFKKKELWIRFKSGKLAIFKWDGSKLIWQLDGAPLARFIQPVKKKDNQKGEGFHHAAEGKK